MIHLLLTLTLLQDPVRDGKEPGKLSLRQCIDLALGHNLDIEVARYQPWIEDQNILAAYGGFDFTAYATGSGGETLTPTGSALSGAEVLDQDTANFTLGMRKTLPFGTTVDVGFTSARTLTNSSFYTINPQWYETFGVALTVPLLRGAGTTSNYSSILIARNTREISVYGFEKSLTESVFAVHQAYWDLVFAIENKKVKDQSLTVARRLRDENQKRFAQGMLAKVDVTSAEAGVAAQEEGILTAEAQVFNAMDRLKRTADPALLRGEEPLWPADAPAGFEKEIDEKEAVERALAEALAHRPDYLQIAREIDSLDVTIVKSERDLWPKFDLTGRAFFSGLSDDLGRAQRDLWDFDTYELTVGFSFEYPLGTSLARGTLERADLEKRRAFLRRRSLEDQILVEVREAVRRIKTDEKRILASKKARTLSQEEFDAETNRQKQGVSTTYRVLDAQERLQRAQTNEIKAMIDYRLSLANLDRVTGTLLAKSDIRLQENLAPRVTVSQR